MAHIGKERGLCLIGLSGMHQRILQRLGLLFLSDYLLRDISGNHHCNHVAGHIILSHDKGLAHAYLTPIILHHSPVIHINFHFSLFKAAPQIFHVHHIAVIRKRFRKDKLLPALKALRGLTGRLQSYSRKQGNLLSRRIFTYNILLDQILCQIKFKGAERIGRNGDPILHLLAVHYRHFFLSSLLALLHFRNVLTQIQHLDRSLLLPLNADNGHLLPFFLSVPHHMAFIGKGVLIGQIFHHGLGFQCLSEILLGFLADNLLAVILDNIAVRSFPHRLIVRELHPGGIGVYARLQIYRQILGRKERI